MATTLCAASAAGDTHVPPHDYDAWSWLPEWRRKGDCGPAALYILMRLEGREVSVEQVQQLVAIDPERGCSILNLAEAAEQLGFPVEVRFVNPTKVTDIPRPFVFHGLSSIKTNTGHYVLAVDYDPEKDLFHMIDPVREQYSASPRGSLLRGFSGYVLLPKYPAGDKWNWIAGISLVIAGVCVMACFLYSKGVCSGSA